MRVRSRDGTRIYPPDPRDGRGRTAARRRARAQDGFRILRAAPGGFDGTVPGPVLRVKRGEEVKVRLVNDLPGDGLTLHWHGVRVPNAMDGGAAHPEAGRAGESFDYRFTPPDAGTFWYRVPFRAAETRGLHGALIVDEAEPVDVDRDLVLVLDATPAPRHCGRGRMSASGCG